MLPREMGCGNGMACWRWMHDWRTAWLSRNQRSRVRYERRSDFHQAFLILRCTLICWDYVQCQFCYTRPVLILHSLPTLVYTGTPVKNAKKPRGFGVTGPRNQPAGILACSFRGFVRQSTRERGCWTIRIRLPTKRCEPRISLQTGCIQSIS